ncbi:MAG TPA: TonB-dependent receptor, partial [Candidatus Synoicihabitans sp.]|nr:TonB-dependent receptor [Candidatus Synoicihabitans sp.]
MNTSASSSSAATPPAALSGLPLRSLALAQSLAVAGLAHAQSPAPAAAPEDLNGDAPHEMPRLTVEEQRRAVSSPKFTAPLVNTPQTVSVIPREIFNQQGAASLADVLGNTPGITFLAGEGGHVSGANSLVMRGFDATGSIFIDGVRDSGNYSRDVYNLEQVEVVKGPAGDNGRGTAAGYINLSTKAPLAADFAHSTVSYGFDEYASIERRRATIDLNQDLDGRIAGAAFRLNALWEDGGVAGRDHAEKNTWGVAPSLIFGLGTATRITLAYQHDEQDDLPDYGALGGILTDTATSVRPRQPVDRSRFYGHVSDFNRVDLDVLSARVEHDITPTMRLTNVSRFSNNDRDAIYTVPANLNAIPDMNTGEALEIVPTNRQAFFREIETLSNQTNLAAQFTTGSVDHAFAAGLELIREDGETLRDWTGLGTLGELSKIVNQTAAGAPTAPTMVVGTSPYQPNPYRPITGFAPTYRFIDDVRIDTAALYAFDTLRFNDRWQATAGLRLEYYEASYNI